MIDLDLLMAYRLIYYVHHKTLIPDEEYDKLDREAKKTAPKGHHIHKPGSDLLESYDPAVRALALYLLLRYAKRHETSREIASRVFASQPKKTVRTGRHIIRVPLSAEAQAEMF